MSIDVDSVFAVPSEVHDPETTAAILGKVLNLDPQEIVASASRLHATSPTSPAKWMPKPAIAFAS